MKKRNYNNILEADFYGYLLEHGFTADDLGPEEDFDALRYFEGDPDIMKIDGNTGYFFEDSAVDVWYWLDEWRGDGLRLLQAFFDGNGGEYNQDRQSWKEWDEIKTGIAYRGGQGYTYAIYDFGNVA